MQSAQAFYNPSTGRWLSRDPNEEKGGLNIQAFVKNDVGNRIDRLGLDSCGSWGPSVLRFFHEVFHKEFDIGCGRDLRFDRFVQNAEG